LSAIVGHPVTPAATPVECRTHYRFSAAATAPELSQINTLLNVRVYQLLIVGDMRQPGVKISRAAKKSQRDM